jgi:hypothetical protein
MVLVVMAVQVSSESRIDVAIAQKADELMTKELAILKTARTKAKNRLLKAESLADKIEFKRQVRNAEIKIHEYTENASIRRDKVKSLILAIISEDTRD